MLDRPIYSLTDRAFSVETERKFCYNPSVDEKQSCASAHTALSATSIPQIEQTAPFPRALRELHSTDNQDNHDRRIYSLLRSRSAKARRNSHAPGDSQATGETRSLARGAEIISTQKWMVALAARSVQRENERSSLVAPNKERPEAATSERSNVFQFKSRAPRPTKVLCAQSGDSYLANTARKIKPPTDDAVRGPRSRNRTADEVRNGLRIAAAQLSSSDAYSAEGESEPARLAAIQAFETVRLTLRAYSTTAEHAANLDWRDGYYPAVENRPEAPATIWDATPMQALAVRCADEAGRCEALASAICVEVASSLRALTGEDCAVAVLDTIGACEVAIAALKNSRGR